MSKHIDWVRLRELAITAGPAIALVAVAFYAASRFIEPAPPHSLTISAGAEGGAYYRFAQSYKDILARDGIQLEVRSSAGALENLARLKDDQSNVSVAFVQSGIANEKEYPDLVSLGRMFHEPLWVVHRIAKAQRLVDLRGKRIAVGAEGSGTRLLALELLKANGITADNATLLPLNSRDSAAQLLAGQIDAAMLVASPQAEVIQKLAGTTGLQLMDFPDAEAYVRRYPHLSRVTLPRGVMDFVKPVPDRELVLLSPSADLVVRDDLHPALVFALAQAAKEVHNTATILNAPGKFPEAISTNLPLSDVATRYYRSGPPFLQRYLPFWVAVLVDRLTILLIPLITVLIPLMKIAPMVYTWRVRRRLLYWYEQLHELEIALEENPGDIAKHRAEVDRIARATNHAVIPFGYLDQQFNLRTHIEVVRRRIERLAEAGSA